MKLGAIILAAGFSSRMGDFKPLLKLEGKTMLEHCASLFRQAEINRIVVVSGHKANEIQKAAKKLNLRTIKNKSYQDGMFSSIQTGVEALAPCDGFFILPVDIPLIRPETIAILTRAFNGKKTLIPIFNKTPGHPPLIPGKMQRQIQQSKGRGGLQRLLFEGSHQKVEVWDAATLKDADTPDAYTALTKAASRRDILTTKEADTLARMYMPPQGIAHGQRVAEIALALENGLPRRTPPLDHELLYGTALLHDIAKGRSHHEREGEKMLHSFGLKRMAVIVGAHKDLKPPADGKLTEKELVCLADKLVCGSQRVKIKERFRKKLALYAEDKEACRAIRRRQRHALTLAELWEKQTGKELEGWLKKKGAG